MALDGAMGASLWGDPNYGFSYRPSVGGLLTMWDIFEVEVWVSSTQENIYSANSCQIS